MKSTVNDILKVTIGSFILGIIQIIIFYLAGYGGMPAILGTLLGCVFCFLNLLFLALTLEKNIGSGKARAAASISFSYIVRLGAAGLMILWAIKAPYLNYVAAIIPLIYQRIVIYAVSYYNSKKGAKKNER